jgi:FkbM family methyltransferase
MGTFHRRIHAYCRLVWRFWRSANSLSDFAKLLRIRLAQSKVGKIVCPSPISRHVGIQSLSNRICLRSHTTDISVLSELIVSDGYDPVLDWIDAPPKTVIDLGANIGLASLWFLSRFPGASVIAVEPERGNASVLRENLSTSENVLRIYEACIGAYEREVTLDSSQGEWANRLVEIDGNSPPGCIVPAIAMDRIIRENGVESIDLLKCDIEGAEIELFESCGSWISKVRLAVVECHDDFDTDKLLELIRKNGTEFECVYRDVKPAFQCEVAILRRK